MWPEWAAGYRQLPVSGVSPRTLSSLQTDTGQHHSRPNPLVSRTGKHPSSSACEVRFKVRLSLVRPPEACSLPGTHVHYPRPTRPAA